MLKLIMHKYFLNIHVKIKIIMICNVVVQYSLQPADVPSTLPNANITTKPLQIEDCPSDTGTNKITYVE